MTDISKSPDRGTFQKEGIIRRAKKKGIDPETDPNTIAMVEFYESFNKRDEDNLNDPAWREYNLEYDLRTTDWILEKVRSNVVYAQNLYAALCNTDFVKNDVWPILADKKWSCSWRYAGGIIADMRQQGDYIDWYCSGIREEYDNGYVHESEVTDEIRSDLLALGWTVKDCDER